MGKAVGGLVKVVSGLLGGKAPKAEAPAPVSVAAQEDVDDATKKSKAARAALYETEGGALGEELTAGGVTRRPTLLGN